MTEPEAFRPTLHVAHEERLAWLVLGDDRFQPEGQVLRFRLTGLSHLLALLSIVVILLAYSLTPNHFWLAEHPEYSFYFLIFAAIWTLAGYTLSVDNNRHLRPALWNHKLYWLLDFIFHLAAFIYDLTQIKSMVFLSLSNYQRYVSLIIDVIFLFLQFLLSTSILMREHSGLYNFVVQR